MIHTPFFILFVIIISGVGVVYAVNDNDCTNVPANFTSTCTTTLTANLAPPVCEGDKVLNVDENECIIPPVCEGDKVLNDARNECVTPPTGGGSGSQPSPPSFSSSGGGSSGGGCRSTGVGPDGSHGHGGASGSIGRDCGRIGVGPGVSGDTRIHNSPHKPEISSDVLPLWISNVVLWWLDDKLTQEEFQNTITYLLDQNVIPNNIPKPDTALVKFEPTTKRIFELWVNGNLKDIYILKLIQDYRQLGIW